MHLCALLSRAVHHSAILLFSVWQWCRVQHLAMQSVGPLKPGNALNPDLCFSCVGKSLSFHVCTIFKVPDLFSVLGEGVGWGGDSEERGLQELL